MTWFSKSWAASCFANFLPPPHACAPTIALLCRIRAEIEADHNKSGKLVKSHCNSANTPRCSSSFRLEYGWLSRGKEKSDRGSRSEATKLPSDVSEARPSEKLQSENDEEEAREDDAIADIRTPGD